MDLTPLYLSAKLALISTVILLAIAAPLTYWLVYSPVRGKFFIESLIGLPLVLPPTVLGFFLLIAMGQEGMIGRSWENLTGSPLVFTFTGIVIAAMAHSLPYAFQPLKTAFERIDQRMLESAYVLGCSKPATFLKVVLPNTINGLAAAAILAFAHTMGEFGVILMVGGSIPGETRVASIAIYEYVEALRYREAWLLSLALVSISYLVLLAVNLLNQRGRNET